MNEVKIIQYVLTKLEAEDLETLTAELRLAEKLLAKMPYYSTDKIVAILCGEEVEADA